MKLKLFRSAAALLALATLGAGAAHAGTSVYLGLNVAPPVYYAPAPTYYAPAPVHYAPPPTVYYVRPAPVYYAEPVYYHGPRHGKRHKHRHHRGYY